MHNIVIHRYSSVPPEISSKSDHVGITVTVNGDSACDEFIIIASIANSSGVIQTQRSNFTNTTIIIEAGGIAAGIYTCFIAVVSGAIPRETKSVPCQIMRRELPMLSGRVEPKLGNLNKYIAMPWPIGIYDVPKHEGAAQGYCG